MLTDQVSNWPISERPPQAALSLGSRAVDLVDFRGINWLYVDTYLYSLLSFIYSISYSGVGAYQTWEVYHIMAGAVRQPIDIPSLERYLNQNVPDIKTPVEVKQVSHILRTYIICTHKREERRLIKRPTVQFRAIKPYLPTHRC